MITIDYSGAAIAAITAFPEDLKREESHVENLIRHAILSTLKSYKKKFHREYGSEVVIACDRSPYWRRDVFKYYKAGRKKAREESDIPWDLVYKYMDLTLQDIKEHFPWKVIEVPGAEADDIMAVMAQDIAYEQNTSLLNPDDPEKTLIITKDKDMKQLMVHPNIRVWNPYTKEYSKLDEKASMFLRRMILTGDPGDGVPNVFSPENSFVDKIRQKPCTEVKMKPFMEAKSLAMVETTPEIKARIETNTKVIALSKMPTNVRENIKKAYYECKPTGNKMSIFKYLAAKQMKLMLDDIDEF